MDFPLPRKEKNSKFDEFRTKVKGSPHVRLGAAFPQAGPQKMIKPMFQKCPQQTSSFTSFQCGEEATLRDQGVRGRVQEKPCTACHLKNTKTIPHHD